MKNKAVGIILVVIVLLIAAYVVRIRFSTPPVSSYQQSATQPPGHGVVGNETNDPDPFDIEIAYTDDGYATTTVSIKQGTRVRFINRSNQQTWPASGIHPTHTLYPEKEDTDCLGSSFDACAALARGEYFDFTFNYVGTWTFHDHLHGFHSGRIIVE